MKLLRGTWNEVYIDELTSFPSGAHDDQVDAMGLPAAELIKISAPREPEKVINPKKTVIGLEGGRPVLNESLDDLFNANESKRQNRFANKRI